MIVGTLQIELLLHGCQSLKEKRVILKGLKTRIGNKFNVSIAEVDYQEKWQRSLLAIACVSNQRKLVEQIFDTILGFIEHDSRVEIIEQLKEIF